MTPYPALIEWHDAHGDATQQVWNLESAEHLPLVIKTLGWVTQNDKVGVTAFTERIDNADGTFSWRGRGFIPRGMIVKVTALGVSRKKSP